MISFLESSAEINCCRLLFLISNTRKRIVILDPLTIACYLQYRYAHEKYMHICDLMPPLTVNVQPDVLQKNVPIMIHLSPFVVDKTVSDSSSRIPLGKIHKRHTSWRVQIVRFCRNPVRLPKERLIADRNFFLTNCSTVSISGRVFHSLSDTKIYVYTTVYIWRNL